jgi:hypothetical protein
MITMILDTVVAVLLGVTILYAVRLDRRLKAFRDGRGEMQALLNGIQEMTTRAEAGIAQFKTVTADGGAELQARVRSADVLRSDLAMLIERGERMAERLQEATRPARAGQLSEMTPPASERTSAGARTQRPRAADLSAVEPEEASTETAFVKALRRAR